MEGNLKMNEVVFEKIIVEKEEGIAVIRLNRPEAMNALDMEIREELAKAIEDIRIDDNIKVLIITGVGRAFCAGGDITTMKEIRADQGRERLKKIHRLLLNLVSMEKPVIAAVNGYAFGGGCNLALAADIIVASENAKFSQSFVKIGLVPDMGGMYFLPRLVGLAKARELMFLGETVDAKEAERIGMINKVVPREDLEKTAKELARKIVMGPSKSIGMTKTILNKSLHLDFTTLLELEAQAQGICFQTDSHKKSVKEFLQKREKA
jgi:2-(1,2-epoxy-1,2-dihydrophenyl)acetyl-CoA isomerase